ncbi:MAG: sugar ABC transporter permease [Desulfovibrionales bacterium]|nr:sugar ABC transporter permease [Desulfovibrionales bacterium]
MSESQELIKLKQRKRRLLHENFIAAIYLLPVFLFLSAFMLYPIINSGYISFFKWNGISKKTFIGFENFIRIVQDEYFYQSLLNNILIGISAIVFQVFIGVIIAYFLVKITQKVQKPFMFLYLIPMVVSEICIGLLWGFIYNPYFGLLNGFLNSIGFQNLTIGWLGNPNTAFIAVVFTMNFTYLGLYVLLFVNAIQNIPSAIFDAAMVDGAGAVKTFFNVVIPMTWDTMVSNMLLCIVSSFKTFSIIFVLTCGGPNHASEVISTYLYKMGFNTFQMGYGSTIGFVQIILTALAGILVMRTMNKSKRNKAYN